VKILEREALKAGVTDRVKFLQQDLFKTDFHERTCWTLPAAGRNLALRPKILASSSRDRASCRTTTGMAIAPDAKNDSRARQEVGARKESRCSCGPVPANVDGEWRFELSSGVKRGARARAQTEYQAVSGTVELTGQGDVPCRPARYAAMSSLTLPAARSTGGRSRRSAVNGGKIVGTLRKAGRT